MSLIFISIPDSEENEGEQAALTNEFICWAKSTTNESDAAKAMEKLVSMESYSFPLSFNKPMDGSLATIIQLTPKEDLSTDGHVLGLMLDSACDGHLENLEFLLGIGLDVNCKLKDDHTALHYAVSNGNLKTVNFLLNHGADVNNLGKGDTTTVHCSAIFGRIEILKVLLDAGANINAKDVSGKTALHHAAIGKQFSGDEKLHVQVIKLLLEKGVNVNDEDKYGQTPLLLATHRKAIEIVDLLLKNGANTDIFSKENVTPLTSAVSQGCTEIVKLLLASGANISIQDDRGINALHLATLKSDEKMVQVLLENGADVNAKGPNGSTPLHLAIKKGSKSIVEFLLNRGANASLKNEEGVNVLHGAILTGNEEMVRIILDSGIDFNARSNDGHTPLHFAVEMKYKKIVEILLDRGVNVDLTLENDTDFNGCTALSLAAVHGGQEDVAKMLLNKGANIHAQDRLGATPLLFAVTKGYTGMVKLLLDNGAKVHDELRGIRHGHALRAAMMGHEKIVELLLQYGAGVNDLQMDVDGRKHLMNAAAFGGQAKMMEFLLEREAIIIAWDAFGTLMITTHKGFEDCAKIVVRELVIFHALYKFKICKNILDLIEKFDYLEKFMKECESELEEMEKPFPDTSISYISVLRKRIDDLALVAANENVLNAVESEDFVKVKFPLYGSKIVKFVLKGVERKKLLDPVARFFNCLYDNEDEKLPPIMPHCSKKIFENLEDEDLRSLAEAFKTSIKL